MLGRDELFLRTSARRSNLSGRTVALVLVLMVALSSAAAAIWDRWPGDVDGMRLYQGSLYTLIHPLMQVVTALGSTLGQVSLVLAAGAWLVYVRRPQLATVLIALVVIETALVWLLKWAVNRPRPALPADLEVLSGSSGNSFPSGHVAFEVFFFGALAYMLVLHWRGALWLRRCLVGLFLVPLALVGPSRIAWGVHWPSDVLGGYLVAMLGMLALVAVLGRLDRAATAEE